MITTSVLPYQPVVWRLTMGLTIQLFLVTLMVYYVSSNALRCNSTIDVIQSINSFTYKALQYLERDGNILFCPLSFSLVFSLVTCGAQGETKDELRNVFYNIPNNNKPNRCCEYKCGFKNLLQLIENDKKMKVATGLFPKSGIEIKPGFQRLGKYYFNTTVQPINFTNPQLAAAIMNAYVEKNTDGQIKNIINPASINGLTLLILINALRFKSDWLKPFTIEYTGDFYKNDGSKVPTKFMEITAQFSYKESISVKVLKLLFEKSTDYYMLFVLPGNKTRDVNLRNYNLEDLTRDMVYTSVRVVLPIFKLEKTIDGKQLCQKLGINKVFTDKAELNCIFEDYQASVTDAVQKTFLNVTKRGVDASAATAISIGVTSVLLPKEEFIANRPFAFYIIRKNLIIFVGQFLVPTF